MSDTEKENLEDRDRTVRDIGCLVLCLQSSRLFTRSDMKLWLIQRLFKSLTINNFQDKSLSLVELSPHRYHPFSNVGPNASTSVISMLDSGSSNASDINNSKWKLMPKSSVFVIPTCSKLVFLVDLFASCATVTSNLEVVFLEALSALERCIVGATNVISVKNSSSGQTKQFTPEIRVTVLGSYIKLRKKQSEDDQSFPFTHGLKVFLHQVQITSENVDRVLERLKVEYLNFLGTLVSVKAYWKKWFDEIVFSPSTERRQLRESSLTLGRKMHASLEYGYFSLRMMPESYEPNFIWITDGVSSLTVENAGIHSILQRFIKMKARCSIIHLAPSDQTSQGFNFGHIQDYKFLKFIALATAGEFIYFTDLPDNSLKRGLGASFYHNMLLVRHFRFSRSKSMRSLVSAGSNPDHLFYSRLNAMCDVDDMEMSSWTLESKAPIVSEILARYREYHLPANARGILESRLREGFTIENIVFMSGRKQRGDKLHINLNLAWLPHVTIQYRIRVLLSEDDEIPFIDNTATLRIQINILAYRSFALCFVNFDFISQNKDHPKSLISKVMTLHNYLKGLIQSDEHFKVIMSFNTKKALYNVPHHLKFPYSEQMSPSKISQSTSENYKAFHNFWNYLNYIIKRTASWFDQKSIEILLSGFSRLKARLQTELDPEAFFKMKRANVYKLIYRSFVEWSSFIINKTTFVRLVYVDEKEVPQGFVVLRIIKENDFLVKVSVMFFNVSFVIREEIFQNLTQRILEVEIPSDEEVCQCHICTKLPRMLLLGAEDTEANVSPGSTNSKISSQSMNQFSSPKESTSQFMKQSYWDWQVSCENSVNISYNNPQHLNGIAYQIILQCKLNQGYRILMETESSAVCFRELELQKQGSLRVACAIKYAISIDSIANHIKTELWVEPCVMQDLEDCFDSVKEFVERTDHLIIGQLFSFDYLSKGLPDLSTKASIGSDQGSIQMVNGTLSISSMIPNSYCFLVMFNIPVECEDNFLDDSKVSLLSSINQDGDTIYITPTKREVIGDQKYNINFLFLYFFEQGLFRICHSALSFDDYPDEFESIFQSLKQEISLKLVINVPFLDLKYYRCFLIPNTFESFHLLLFPSYSSMELSNCDNGKDSMILLKSLHIFIFHCYRPKDYSIIAEGLEQMKPNQYHGFPITVEGPFSLSLEQKRNNWQPSFSHITPNHLVKEPSLSERTRDIIKSLNEISEQCYTRTVYGKLLEGRLITNEEFQKSLSHCVEFSLDLEITEYLNALVLTSSKNTASAQKSFQELIMSNFREIKFQNSGDNGKKYYFYQPSDATARNQLFWKSSPVQVELSNTPVLQGCDGDIFSQIMRLSESPLFIRIECSFQLPKKSTMAPDDPKMVFPQNKLPDSYHIHHNGEYYDFSPSGIGLPSSPLASSDGTSVTLHFICSVLPDSLKMIQSSNQGAPNSVFSKTFSSESVDRETSFRPYLQRPPDILKNISGELSHDKQESLNLLMSSIQFLIREETMYLLLEMDNASQDIIHFIVSQLKSQIYRIRPKHCASIGLPFVRPEEGRHLFMSELEKVDMQPYKLHRTGDYFFIQDSVSFIYHSSFQQPETTTQSDYLASTFGISVESDDDIPKMLHTSKPCYWVLIVPELHHTSIYVFSKDADGVDRSYVTNYVKEVIQKVYIRVNRILLLRDLIDTHSCSKYIIPQDRHSIDEFYESESSEEDSSLLPERYLIERFTNDGTISESSRFRPGEFKCPLVYKHVFPLHWRLKSSSAMNIIKNTLHPFEVTNRKNMFVIAKNDSVFYMKLKECNTNDISDDFTTKEFNNQQAECGGLNSLDSIPTFPIHNKIEEEQRQISFNSTQPASTISKLSNSISTRHRTNKEHNALVLKVFGVDPPGEELTGEFVSMLQSKLTSAVLSILGTFLSRSTSFKLTKADVEFILPIQNPPFQEISLFIPEYMIDIHGFISLFKQNLLGYLHPLGGQEIDFALGKYNESRFNVLMNHKGHTLQFALLFNNSPNESVTAEVSPGTGMTSMIFNLKKNQKSFYEQTIPNVPGKNSQLSLQCKIDQIKKYLENSQSEQSCSYLVKVALWIQGTVNIDTLIGKIRSSFQQTIYDYLVEDLATLYMKLENEDPPPGGEILAKSLDMTLKKRFLGLCKLLLDKSIAADNLAVKHYDHAHHILPNESFIFAQAIEKHLVFMDPEFNPKLIKLKDDNENIIRLRHISSETVDIDSSIIDYDFALVAMSKPSENNAEQAKKPISPVSATNVWEKPRYFDLTLMDRARNKRRREIFLKELQSSENVPTKDKKSLRHRRRVSASASISFNIQSVEEYLYYRSNEMDQVDEVETPIRTQFFCILLVGCFGVSIRAYNLNSMFTGKLVEELKLLSRWQTQRKQILNTVCNYKLGLFHLDDDYIMDNEDTWKDASNEVASIQSLSNFLEATESFSLIPLPFTPNASRDVSLLFAPSSDKHFFLLGKRICEKLLQFPKNWIFNEPIVTHYSDQDTVRRHTKKLFQVYVDNYLQSNASGRHENRQEVQTHVSDYSESGREVYDFFPHHFNCQWFKSVRLVHWSRCPILFTQQRDWLFQQSGNSYICSFSRLQVPQIYSSGDVDAVSFIAPEMVGWYDNMIQVLIEHYVAYLETLGMKLIKSGRLEESILSGTSSPSKLTFSKKSSSDSSVVYLAKPFQAGAIVCEVGMRGMFFLINVYTLDGLYCLEHSALSNVSSSERRQYFKSLTEECANLKNLIHPNSFIYDFHLFFFQQAMDMKVEHPSSLDFLGILTAFHRYYPRAASFSRNRLYRGVFHADPKLSPNNLFHYIAKNPSKYGFQSLKFQDHINSFYVSSNSPDFSMDREELGSRRFTILAFPCKVDGTDSEQKMDMNFFLLCINGCSPNYTMAERRWIRPAKEGEDLEDSPFEECLWGDVTLEQIVENAKKRLSAAVEQAHRYYRRDALWRQLAWNDGEHLLSTDSFLLLSQRFNSRPLIQFDQSLTAFFSDTRFCWNELFDFLVAYYGKDAREMVGTQNYRHVALFNPQDRDFLVYFCLSRKSRQDPCLEERSDISEGSGQFTADENHGVGSGVLFTDGESVVTAFAISREWRLHPDSLELEHVSGILRSICFFLWAKVDQRF